MNLTTNFDYRLITKCLSMSRIKYGLRQADCAKGYNYYIIMIITELCQITYDFGNQI